MNKKLIKGFIFKIAQVLFQKQFFHLRMKGFLLLLDKIVIYSYFYETLIILQVILVLKMALF